MKTLLIAPLVGFSAPDHLPGPGHPVVGRYFDAGSYGLVRRARLDDILGDDFAAAAAAAGLLVSHGVAAASAALVVLPAVHASDAAPTIWEAWLGGGGCFGLICVSDADGQLAWSLTGYGLPSFGALPRAAREDLWATWFTLCGGRPDRGEYLLQEPEATVDPAGDAALTERLRLLYGE